ncbi:hypothetical protein, partial [Lichenifustis flavocetrariae]
AQFFLDHLLDETTHLCAHIRLDRIELTVEKRAGARIDRRFRRSLLHGVISPGVDAPSQGLDNLEITPPSISNHSRDGTTQHARSRKQRFSDTAGKE